jgi:NADH-quinone oxidoreductase subunit M
LFGPIQVKFNLVKDTTKLETVYLIAFMAIIFLVGIYPAVLTNVINSGVSPIMNLIFRQ